MKVVLALTLVPRIGARHILAELLALAVSVAPTKFAIAQPVECELKVELHAIALASASIHNVVADDRPGPCAV